MISFILNTLVKIVIYVALFCFIIWIYWKYISFAANFIFRKFYKQKGYSNKDKMIFSKCRQYFLSSYQNERDVTRKEYFRKRCQEIDHVFDTWNL
jgi:hypothetical protein